MPAFEIHVETYFAESFPVVEADSAYEAAISYAGRYAPCKIRRTNPEAEGDTFVITATGSTDDIGLTVEVYEHDPEHA